MCDSGGGQSLHSLYISIIDICSACIHVFVVFSVEAVNNPFEPLCFRFCFFLGQCNKVLSQAFIL